MRLVLATIEFLELESGNGVLARAIVRCLLTHGHEVGRWSVADENASGLEERGRGKGEREEGETTQNKRDFAVFFSALTFSPFAHCAPS